MNENQRRMIMTYFVTEQWLKDQLENQADLVIVDVRSQLNDAESGKKAYTENHIQHAVYLDLKDDLSGEIKEHGGSHPLPETEKIVKTLGNIGVDEQTTVIIYSNENDMFSARMWWMLHYLGHTKMYILTGGYQAWMAAGNKVTNDISVPKPKQYEPNVLTEATVDISDVKNKMRESTSILIDSRARDRYLGKVEPLYKKAGHIPGAKNYFWKDVFHADGSWKSVDELKEHFSAIPKEAEIIVSCGSGISACPNIIGLKLAGYKNVKLYPGSYSDWLSYPDNPIETREE